MFWYEYLPCEKYLIPTLPVLLITFVFVGKTANENMEFTSYLSAAVLSRYNLIGPTIQTETPYRYVLNSMVADEILNVKFLIILVFKKHTRNYWGTKNLSIKRLKFVIFIHLKNISKFLKFILMTFHWNYTNF